MTNATDEILSGVDLTALANQLGASPDEVRQAAQTAIPTLLGSMQANAADPAGQQSLLGALGQHTEPIHDLDAVDTEDGRRILGHVFADNPSRIQPLAGQNGDLLARLLPVLAPLVMSWLSRQVLGGGRAGQSSGGGLADLLGGMLGGAGAGNAGAGGLGEILGQVLGGALGGGSASFPGAGSATGTSRGSQSSGDALGDLLGQILGRR